MITREIVVRALKERLEPLDYIYAMWLEGADAIGGLDEYSDIDICVDFEDEHEKRVITIVEEILSELGELDYKYVAKHGHPKLRQRVYHLKNSNEYLMIDFCFQLHSRNKEEFVYIKESKIENAKILFDKAGIIQYKEYNEQDFKLWNDSRLEECKYRYSQHSRVMKYVHRGLYLEAYAYYNKYVIEPLIDLLRLIYIPANANYYLIHISQHIPYFQVKKLESFAKVSSVEEIAKKVSSAQIWFSELIDQLGKIR